MKVINLDNLEDFENPWDIINGLGITYITSTSARDRKISDNFCDFMIREARPHFHAIGYLGSTLRGTSYEVNNSSFCVNSDIDVVLFTGNEVKKETKLENIREILKKTKKFKDMHQVELDIQILDLDLIIGLIEKSSLATVFLNTIMKESMIFGKTEFFDLVCERLNDLINTDERLRMFNELYLESGRDYGSFKQSISRCLYNSIFLQGQVVHDEQNYCSKLFKTKEI